MTKRSKAVNDALAQIERFKEIDSTIAALRKAWFKHPSLRLAQLVCNVSPGDPYYVEDATMKRLLEGS